MTCAKAFFEAVQYCTTLGPGHDDIDSVWLDISAAGSLSCPSRSNIVTGHLDSVPNSSNTVFEYDLPDTYCNSAVFAAKPSINFRPLAHLFSIILDFGYHLQISNSDIQS